MSNDQAQAAFEIVLAADAPQPIGPYSQAVVVGSLLYCSGQIPLNPSTGRLVEGDIEQQTEQVMQNIRAVLHAAGSGFEKVIKTTIYLLDMADFSRMNPIYGAAFPSKPPARSTVAVVGLPLGSRIEIEVLALL